MMAAMQTEVLSPDDAIVEVITDLTAEIGLNEFGMPLHILRPDLIPPHYYSLDTDERRDVYERAKVPLFYHDGFPTTPSGSLIWDRLDHESPGDFLLFEQYLKMSEQHGYRSIQVLAKSLAAQNAANRRARAQAKAEHTNVFLDVETPPKTPLSLAADSYEEHEAEVDNVVAHLRTIFVFFFWRHRAEAFDLVGQAAIQRVRASRAILLEDNHFRRMSGMVQKIMDRFDRFDEEDLEELNPVDTVRVLKELVHLQRVAVGLPASAPASSNSPAGGSSSPAISLEDHLRTVAASKKASPIQADLTNQMGDEDTVELAQELTIRLMLQNRT